MFRRICNPPKFTIRICNPLKPHINIMMYVGERIANPHLETAGLQIRRNKERPSIEFIRSLFGLYNCILVCFCHYISCTHPIVIQAVGNRHSASERGMTVTDCLDYSRI